MTGKIELPVKRRVHESVFVPLAKWSMLLAGNYGCVTAGGEVQLIQRCQTAGCDIGASPGTAK